MPLEVSFKVDSGRCRSFSHWIRSAKFSDGPPLASHLRRPVWGPVWLVMVGCCHLRQFNLKGPTCKHFWKLLFPLNMQGLTYKLQSDKTVSKICLELAILKLSKQDRLYKKRPFHWIFTRSCFRTTSPSRNAHIESEGSRSPRKSWSASSRIIDDVTESLFSSLAVEVLATESLGLLRRSIFGGVGQSESSPPSDLTLKRKIYQQMCNYKCLVEYFLQKNSAI